MTSIAEVRLRLRGQAAATDSACSVIHTHPQFSVASILQEFDDQRRELMTRNLGSVGAFAGFTRLDTRPKHLLDLPDGSPVVVRTTLCDTGGRQSLVELIAHEANDPTSLLVSGVGVAIPPAGAPLRVRK